MSSVKTTQMSVLAPEDATSFVHDGYVVVRRAFPREIAERLLPYVWSRLPERADDPATWQRVGAQIEEVIEEGPIEGLLSERLTTSVDELAGAGKWHTRRGFGWVIMRFPESRPWTIPHRGWHVDGMDYQHHLTSPQIGLVGIELLSDVKPHGGGTVLKVGSHRVIARQLQAAEPEGISYSELRRISEEMENLPVFEMSGEAGDVLWMHPHMVHARSTNASNVVRIAANRSIVLHEPLQLHRSQDDEYSLVELAIISSLNEVP